MCITSPCVSPMCSTYVYRFSFGDSKLPPFYHHLRCCSHNKLLAATTTSSSNSKSTLIMKVSLFSLLALASSAWAKDSTIANKGSNPNYDRNRKLKEASSASVQSQSASTKSGKSGGCGDSANPRTRDAGRGMTLILIAHSFLQTLGSWDDEVGSFLIPWGSVSTLVGLMPGLVVSDTDGDGNVGVGEMVDALVVFFEGESLDGFILTDDNPAEPASAPFFGFMGVTAALLFANIGAAYGTAGVGML